MEILCAASEATLSAYRANPVYNTPITMSLR